MIYMNCADNALLIRAADLAGYPSAGLRWSFNLDSNDHSLELYLFSGGDSVTSWDPITREKDLYSWLTDIGLNPFHHGFIVPIQVGSSIGVPEGYEPTLGPFDDKESYSRNLVNALVEVLK